MDDQLRLHINDLSLLLEPTFKRQSIGYYSVNEYQRYLSNDSEKSNLVALKEVERSSQGVTEYEVPHYLEKINLTQGYEQYNDEFDVPEISHLTQWLTEHTEFCTDVDIVCSSQILAKVYKAPYTEPVSKPWEVRVTRGPDGICYLEEDKTLRGRYNEMNMYGKQQIFRQRAFKRYMTIKKGDHARLDPPHNYGPALYKISKLYVDSGTVVYQSEVQCFNMNYNGIDFKVQREGHYDLPSPSVRLNWWTSSHLAGSSAIICGYYDDEDDNILTRAVSFDLKHVKPVASVDAKFDEELCAASVCTFVQFVKDLMADRKVASCTLRFEPGSKRVCILDIASRRRSLPGEFLTQLSETDELSSVEATPRAPDDDADNLSDIVLQDKLSSSSAGSAGTIPRLRKAVINDTGVSPMAPPWSRNKTLSDDAGKEDDNWDSDDNKYRPKRRRRRKADDEDYEINWLHVSIILVFIAITIVGIPTLLERLGARA